MMKKSATPSQIEVVSLLLPGKGATTHPSATAGLAALRKTILSEGLPVEDDGHGGKAGKKSSVRSMAWKVLLAVDALPANEFLDLVKMGDSVAHDKIRNDTFRTLATDAGFTKRVKEDMLVRLLDAFVWKSLAETQNFDFGYVQGMNVLAAPFLYTMPSELEAFYCFHQFIELCCPLYVQQTLEGVHRGLKLLDSCLAILDPELFAYLKGKGLSAELYAFASILTFSAGTPPLEEILHLWDFYFAYGFHLNVLCVAAQLYLIREELLAQASPMKVLRTFPPLNARSTIALCCQFVNDLPPDLYDKLARHPWDSQLVI